MAKLGDVCEILDSKRIPIPASDRMPGPYPYYGANGIQDYVADFIFDDELILLAEDGGNFGSKDKPIAYRVSGKCWVNNHAHVLKPRAGYDIDYVCYSLMYYDVSNLVNGATRQKLTQADMRKMVIPDRKLAVQQHISATLGKLNTLISLRKQQLAKLDEVVKARFVEMFGDPAYKNNDPLSVPMTEICEIIDGDRGKNYPKQEEFFEQGHCLFLNAKNVTGSGFSFDTCAFITEEKDKLLRKGKLRRGDIVLTTRGTIGNLAFYDDTIPFESMRINSGMVILRIKKHILEELFFIEQFKMILPSIKEKLASGSAQPQLPISTMSNILLLLPSIDSQRKFVKFVEQIHRKKFTIQQSLDKLEMLKKSLIQEYFG